MGTMDKGMQRESMGGNGVSTGTAQEHEQLVRKMFAALNEHNASKVLPYYADSIRYTAIALNQTYQGHDGMTKYLNNWMQAFPDYKLEITNIVISGSKCVCEYTARGTHTGTFHSAMGDIPATNKRAELRFIDSIEITNGRISAVRGYFDTNSLMSQLGLTTKH